MVFLIFSWTLILVAAAFDLKSKTLPLMLIYLCAAWSFIYSVVRIMDKETTPHGVLLSLLPGIVLLTAHLFGGGVGAGDAYFAMALGPLFGMEKMSAALLLSFFFCAVLAMVLLVLKKVTRKTALPFLPFFAAGMGVIQFVW